MTRAGLLTFLVGVLSLTVVEAAGPDQANDSGVGQAEETAKVSKVSKKTSRVDRRMRQLFGENYRPPSQADAESRKMQALVDKLNAMSLSSDKLRRKRQADQAAKAPKPVKAPAPQPVVAAKPKQVKVAPKPLPAGFFRKLRDAAGDQLANPIGLADALYKSGSKAQAYEVYDKILKHGGLSDADAGWVLYQLANCRAETNPAEARELLRRLISQYPDSPWSMLAENQQRVLEWLAQVRPKRTLGDAKKVLRENTKAPQATGRADSPIAGR